MKNVFIVILFSLLLFGCSGSPSDKDIINTIYNKEFANSLSLQLLLDMKIQSTGSPTKNGNIKMYPVTVKINYIQGEMEMGYTGQGPGKFANEGEVEVVREYMFAKNDNGNWYIVNFRNLSSREYDKVWRPGDKTMKEFYKDRIVFNTTK